MDEKLLNFLSVGTLAQIVREYGDHPDRQAVEDGFEFAQEAEHHLIEKLGADKAYGLIALPLDDDGIYMGQDFYLRAFQARTLAAMIIDNLVNDDYAGLDPKEDTMHKAMLYILFHMDGMSSLEAAHLLWVAAQNAAERLEDDVLDDLLKQAG